MNSLWALALLCVSPVETVGSITIANKVPASCAQVLGSPPLPVSPQVNLADMPYNPTQEAVQAVPAPVKASTPKKAKKPPTARKKRSGGKCKPGRWRNARGICGRWG